MVDNHYALAEQPVDTLDVSARATFITRTYSHLFGALVGFVAIECALFMTGAGETIALKMLALPWMAILGAFVVIGWLASTVAHSARSLASQYAALVGFVLAEALIFLPLLYLAFHYAPGAVSSAAIVSLGGFAALTMIAFMTRKDFTAWGSILRWIGLCAIGAIVAGAIFGFELGTWFSVGMVAFAGAAILYDTSKVLHHYPEDRYVGASLELFASTALLFWYVLRIFMSRD